MSARRLEAGELELGGGLEVLLAAALEGMAADERLEIVTPLGAQRARRHLGRRCRRAGRARVRRAVGRLARHPLGSRPRASRLHGAGREPGDDLHRPERVRGALRPGGLPGRRQPALPRSAHVAGGPRARRGPPRRSVHQALSDRRAGELRARLDRALAAHAAGRADFGAAALLLNVLGEGTFLDLLRFVERYAPDAATRAAAALAHRDEVRHVHFGVSHVRRRIADGPDEKEALVAAAQRRADKLTEMSGLSPLLTEGLTVMAAGSLQSAELARGAAAVRELMRTMEENRIRRLRAAGFDQVTARHLSDLHTPNLM